MVVRPLLVLIICSICSCAPDHQECTQVDWLGDRAVGLSISYAGDMDDISISLQKTPAATKILGHLSTSDGMVHFRPLIDLTYQQTYFVFAINDVLDSVRIPIPAGVSRPELEAIYPSADILPQNLLKMYFVFTKPIAEGALRAVDVITITQKGDTLLPFLDLQPELWNEDRTRLTLWLDPGRLKSGLIPNLELGLPLDTGFHELTVSDKWSDKFGLTLSHVFSKKMYVTGKDAQKPNPRQWRLITPSENSLEPLEIIFDEPLDYVLATEGIHLFATSGDQVDGSIYITDGEVSAVFLPSEKWTNQKYRIQLDAIIEDRSGNNLNRLFEEPVNNQESDVFNYYSIEFHPVSKDETSI